MFSLVSFARFRLSGGLVGLWFASSRSRNCDIYLLVLLSRVTKRAEGDLSSSTHASVEQTGADGDHCSVHDRPDGRASILTPKRTKVEDGNSRSHSSESHRTMNNG